MEQRDEVRSIQPQELRIRMDRSLAESACAASKMPSFLRNSSMLEPIFCLLIRRTLFGSFVPFPNSSKEAQQQARRLPRRHFRTDLPKPVLHKGQNHGPIPSYRRPAFGRHVSFVAGCGFIHVERIPRAVPDMDDANALIPFIDLIDNPVEMGLLAMEYLTMGGTLRGHRATFRVLIKAVDGRGVIRLCSSIEDLMWSLSTRRRRWCAPQRNSPASTRGS
jgi:hypothetical protein